MSPRGNKLGTGRTKKKKNSKEKRGFGAPSEDTGQEKTDLTKKGTKR